jgi:PAS domain S-box-containing protein
MVGLYWPIACRALRAQAAGSPIALPPFVQGLSSLGDAAGTPDLTFGALVQRPAQEDAHLRRRRLGICAAAFVCGLIGLAVLAGWTFDIAALKSILPGFIAMQPWTAVSFILASCALSLVAASLPVARKGSAIPLLGLAAIAGSATLEQLTGATFGMDTWLFPGALVSSQTHNYPFPGRTSLMVAFSLISLAGALMLAPRAKGAVAQGAFSTLATLPLVAGLVTLLAYSIRLEPLSVNAVGGPIALHSAFVLIVLAIGTLALRPGAGWVYLISRNGRVGRPVAMLASLFGLLLILGTNAAINAGAMQANVAVSGYQLQAALSTLKDAETGQRGYLLTGKDAYLEPYEAARAHLPRELAAAQASIPVIYGQTSANLSRVRSLISEKLAELAETIALQRAGRAGDALALVDTDRGKATMDAIRTESVALIATLTLAAQLQSNHAWFISEGAVTGLAILAISTFVSLARVKRRQREGAISLAISQARQHALGEAVDYGIWASDIHGHPIYASPSLLKFTGITQQAFRRDGWRSALSPTDAKRIADVWRVCLKTEAKWELEHSLRGHDDKWHPVLARGVPVFDTAGVLSGWTGINLDISRLKETEERLKESETLFQLMASKLPQITWITDHLGKNIFFNERWVEYTGLTQEDSRGDGWNTPFHPDDQQSSRDAWKNAVDNRTTYSIESRLRRTDGTYHWWLVRGEPHINEDGTISKWFGTCTDIEDIIKAREVLARSQAELEALVEQRTQDLVKTQTKLAHLQRMDALGQLAGGIAHDFNNVMQAVQSGAAMIERKPADVHSVRRIARMVFEAAERGASITRRLLVFSRRGDLRTAAVDPVALLADLREVLVHTLGTGIEIRVEAPFGMPPLLADKGQLETVLVNLAANARDAMEGTGVLKLAAAAEVLNEVGPSYPDTLKLGSYICLSVTDTGAGMVPEVLARVTEPFFTTKEQGKGTGLGLAMARGFTEQSGGGLHIESAPGRGTNVKLWFPLAGPISSAPNLLKTSALASPQRARLLIVDDDPIVLDITAEGLEAEGYSVLSAEDGAAALTILDAGETMSVIICDLSMPGMDGLAVIREAQRRRPGLPAILLTGFMSNTAELALSEGLAGPFSLLRKPTALTQLAEQVEMLLAAMPMPAIEPVAVKVE